MLDRQLSHISLSFDVHYEASLYIPPHIHSHPPIIYQGGVHFVSPNDSSFVCVLGVRGDIQEHVEKSERQKKEKIEKRWKRQKNILYSFRALIYCLLKCIKGTFIFRELHFSQLHHQSMLTLLLLLLLQSITLCLCFLYVRLYAREFSTCEPPLYCLCLCVPALFGL